MTFRGSTHICHSFNCTPQFKPQFVCFFVCFFNHKNYHFKKSLLNTFLPQITANQPLLPNGTRVSRPIAAVFSMSPLCIWAVHMSQGVHVWSLHGSISCTHWSILHLCILRINKKIIKIRRCLGCISQCGLLWLFGEPQTWTTNPTWSLPHFHQAYILQETDSRSPPFSGHIEVDPKIYRGNGPQLSDQLVPTSVGDVDYSAENIYNTTCIVLCFDMMMDDFCRGCVDHKNIVISCQ